MGFAVRIQIVNSDWWKNIIELENSSKRSNYILKGHLSITKYILNIYSDFFFSWRLWNHFNELFKKWPFFAWTDRCLRAMACVYFVCCVLEEKIIWFFTLSVFIRHIENMCLLGMFLCPWSFAGLICKACAFSIGFCVFREFLVRWRLFK